MCCEHCNLFFRNTHAPNLLTGTSQTADGPHQISLTNTLAVRHSESQYSSPSSLLFLWLPVSFTPLTKHPHLFLSDLLWKPQHTLLLTQTDTHTHWLTTEAEAWWSHTNKAATGNTWCCDSTSSVPAEDIKNGCPPDHPTVKWVTVNRCAVAQIKFRPVCFLYSLLLMFIAVCSFWRPQWIKKGKQCQNDVLQLRFYKQVITSSWVYNYSTVQ